MITLNLLPPDRLRHLALSRTVATWRAATWLIAGVAVLLLLGTFVLSFGLQQRLEAVRDEVANLEHLFDRSDASNVRPRIKRFNAAVQAFDQALATDRAWAADTTRLLASLPAKPQITEFILSSDGAVVITGVSRVRADFLAFDEAIKKNTLLTNVKTDSTASRRENLPFRYTATLQPAQP